MWGYTAQTSEWLRVWSVSRALWPSIYLHMAPLQLRRLLAAAYFAPYLGMADEPWQLMSEQPVKKTACNEESAAWETDAIIFQIKLFPCSAGAISALAGSMCWWLSRDTVGYSEIFVFWTRGGGEANILALPTRVKMWLYTYSFIENAESGLQTCFGQLPVDEASDTQSQTADLNNNRNLCWLESYLEL